MTKLVLIRHAQSLHNANDIIGGDPELTEKGRDQALESGRKLSEKYGDEFDFMVISGMKRTNQTAEIINQFLNVESISYNGELKEKHYGIYENKDLNKNRADIHFLNEVIPGGDSETAFIARITKALCGYLKGSEFLGII